MTAVGAPERAARLPVGDEKRAMVREMFDAVAPRYDLLNRIISMGLDISWRKRSVRALGLAPGAVVLDVASGTGDLSRILAKGGLVPVGVDMSPGMLGESRTGTPVVLGDAVSLPFRDGAFDGAVCGFAIRNFTDIGSVFSEIARVVRPGGRIAILEVAIPSSRTAKAGYRIWFGRAVPLIGRLLSDPAAYRYLPDSVEYLPPPERMKTLLRGSGFRSVGRRTFSAGATQLFTGTAPGGPVGPGGSGGPVGPGGSGET
jgi:demethylmenaquinone methyltransferase / 2-methoxy-6-polyprenyl-1,4-benzoquinol methylase